MKSAYELAMERLRKTAPEKKLTAGQKARLAELDSLYQSKFAQGELAYQNSLKAAQMAGDAVKIEQLQTRFAADREKLAGEREAKKNRVREEG